MIEIQNLYLLSKVNTTDKEINLFIGTGYIEFRVRKFYTPVGSKERFAECTLNYPEEKFNVIDMKDVLKTANDNISEIIAVKNN